MNRKPDSEKEATKKTSILFAIVSSHVCFFRFCFFPCCVTLAVVEIPNAMSKFILRLNCIGLSPTVWIKSCINGCPSRRILKENNKSEKGKEKQSETSLIGNEI